MKTTLNILIVLLSFSATGQSFPEKCRGIWEGTMQVYQDTKLIDTPKVVFKVAPIIADSSYYWRTSYYSQKYGEIHKDYKLIVKDKKLQTYLIDEGNDLYLDAQVIGNKMYSTFEVGQNSLHSTYILNEEQLYFEVVTAMKDGDSTAIKSYPVINVQYVTLSRKLE